MLERIKKNINEWHFHSLGMTILAIIVILKGHIEISFVLMGISIVLMGIGTLYNQNKEQGQKLDKILDNQKKTQQMLLKAMVYQREDVIYKRMKDLESGKAKVLTKEEFDSLLDVANNKDKIKEWTAK